MSGTVGSRSAGRMKFQAIFFDLFNTLLHFDFSRLPRVDFEGEEIHTTTVEVYRRLKETRPVSFSHSAFLKEFIETRRIVRGMRGREYREIPSLQRFQILCQRLALDPESASTMVSVHMEEMFRSMYLPEENRRLLDHLSDYPMILISNFDHAPTARRALRHFRLQERFDFVFISEEVGWRKPGERLFRIVLEKTAHRPDRCLYVGDDPSADVWGATRSGFQVAWLAGNRAPEDLVAPPRWVLRTLPELLSIAGDGPPD